MFGIMRRIRIVQMHQDDTSDETIGIEVEVEVDVGD